MTDTDTAPVPALAIDPSNCLFRNAAIEFYRDSVRDAMLNRIVMFSADPAFNKLCTALAEDIDISETEASGLLGPVSQAIYKAAESTAQITQLDKTTGVAHVR